ncbi:MAG: hypothetical protein ACREEE_01480, partial [Dongiaceae bacterium]
MTSEIEPDSVDEISDPTFVRRLAIGMALVVLLAAPTLVVLSVASHEFLHPANSSATRAALVVPMMSSGAVLLLVYGFWYAVAAAFSHTGIIGVLAHKGADSPWIAVGFGCAIGMMVPLAFAFMSMTTAVAGENLSKLEGAGSWPYFALTGTLMGWLNWWIAIRPRRLGRTNEPNEDAAIVPSLLRAFVGIMVTSLAAGPTFALLTLGNHIVGGPPAATPLIIGAAAFFGIILSLPASVINAAILSVL